MSNDFNQYNLSQEITKALRDLDYYTPSEVQQKVLPHALNNEDLIVKAQMAVGKQRLLRFQSAKILTG